MNEWHSRGLFRVFECLSWVISIGFLPLCPACAYETVPKVLGQICSGTTNSKIDTPTVSRFRVKKSSTDLAWLV